MSKERLEEAKLMARMLRVETRLPHNFPFDLIDWLVEQAELAQGLEMTVDFYQSALRDADRRVQELEEEVNRLNEALHYQLSQENIRNEENRKLRYKNKRYCEALEKIKQKGELMNYTTGRKSYNGQAEIARKALEESK